MQIKPIRLTLKNIIFNERSFVKSEICGIEMSQGVVLDPDSESRLAPHVKQGKILTVNL